MHIEDLITLMAMRIQMNSYDTKIVSSFHDQIFIARGFTEKQANLAIKIITRQKPKIEEILGQPIDQFIENPTFRLGKRSISTVKTISIFEDKTFGKVFKVVFPYTESIVEKIRKSRTNLNVASWDKDEKAWLLSADERSLSFLMDLSVEFEFDCDETVQNYFRQATEIKENLEKYIPSVCYDNKIITFKNIRENVPTIQTDDVLEALFFARKIGVQVWDAGITELLNKKSVNQTVTDFLDSSPGEKFSFDIDENPLAALSDIVKYLLPCIVVIPGGSELEKLSQSMEFLKKLGISNDEMSTMFRLPTETGGTFNKFVKDQCINNPLTEKTKAVFVSGKLPKTIVESGIRFNCVLNFNFYGIHYSIREFLSRHHNVINITNIANKKNVRGINFASL